MDLEYIGLPPSVTDIGSLSGMPLRSLDLFATGVSNLEQVLTLPNLEYLNVFPGTLEPGWEKILRRLTGLKILSCDEAFSPLSPEEFWRLYDRGQLRGDRKTLTASGRSRLVFKNSQSLSFRWIPPDVYMMGSPLSEVGREEHEQEHYVCLNRGFYMATTPVRVRDFAAFVEASGYITEAEREGWAYTRIDKGWDRTDGASWRSPGFDQSEEHPVVCVSWHDAQAYIEWLRHTENKHYRLPTESEWEYACRAGSTTPFYDEISESAWFGFDGRIRTHAVGMKKANAWDLHDMHGNIWEFCSDWYGPYPKAFVIDPSGPPSGEYRVIRGGCWYSIALNCRSALRYFVPQIAATIMSVSAWPWIERIVSISYGPCLGCFV